MQNILVLIILSPTPEWDRLSTADKQPWLEDVICSLSEFEIGPGGTSSVIWSCRNTADPSDPNIYMIWNVATVDAGNGIVETLRRQDVQRYFDFKVAIVGETVQTNDDAIQAFL
jgi:hypothetical protein